MYSKTFYYVLYLGSFITAQLFSMRGQFISLPYKDLSYWESYKMAIPYAWMCWIFMTYAIYINNKYQLTTPMQVIFILIIVQSLIMVLINKYYFNKVIFNSDILGFFVMLIGFYISLYHLVSYMLDIPIPKKEDEPKLDDTQKLDNNQ